MTRTVTSLPFTELPVAEGNYGVNRVTIDKIVIHTMVGSASSAASRFNTYGQQVSAHYGVKLDGSLIHWLEENLVAYHAGSMSMNQRSIGIEHEDNGDYNGVRPDSLYTASAKLVKDICNFYNIPIDRQHIIKHSEVIATGCPDTLDIDRIVREASGIDTSTVAVPKSDFENLVKKSSAYDLMVNAGYPSVDDINAKLNTQANQINGLNIQVIKLANENRGLKTDNDVKQNVINHDVGQINDLNDQLAKCLLSKPTQVTTQPYRVFKILGHEVWFF